MLVTYLSSGSPVGITGSHVLFSQGHVGNAPPFRVVLVSLSSSSVVVYIYFLLVLNEMNLDSFCPVDCRPDLRRIHARVRVGEGQSLSSKDKVEENGWKLIKV